MVNFVKARPLNICVFSALCNDMGSDHVTLLQHTEVRWLSRWQSIDTFFYLLRGELKVFFTDHNFHLSDRLHDDKFLTQLAYLGDVFSCLNDLNLELQGLSATIFNVWDRIEAMIKKLEIFSVCINKNNIQVFHHCMIFLCVNELKLTDNVKCGIAKHLSELGAQLHRYFPETDDTTTGFVIPFMPCLQSTYRYLNKRATSKLQQVVLWKCNLIRSHWQISGLGCAQSILPWQIALLQFLTIASTWFLKLWLLFSRLYTQKPKTHTTCKMSHLSCKTKHFIINYLNSSWNCVLA
jgi:hypothetical protein